MRSTKVTQTTRPHARGDVGVIVAGGDGDDLGRCVESVREHTDPDTTVLCVAASAEAVNRAFDELAPADCVLLVEPCVVATGWLQGLREAARNDTNTATASALVDAGTPLAVADAGVARDPEALARDVAEHSLRLRPRLAGAVGPCVYIRREALELVGGLDEELDLGPAVEVDLSQRCVLCGLGHVAADDVVVAGAGRAGDRPVHGARPARGLLERYPYLEQPPAAAEEAVLAHALQAARGPDGPLSVTLDARALAGSVTGTHVHILELILALAHTGALRMRLLLQTGEVDGGTLELLRGLPDTELLDADQVNPETPRSTVFHRVQQSFSQDDVAFALTLGERVVLSQLDLIAYRNPGYFPDASRWEDYRRASRLGLSAADRVVVFSDHTRRELLSDALVEDSRIRIVPPGLDRHAPVTGRRPGTLGENPPDRFMLCLGTDFRHKNRVFALRLLASLRDVHGWQGSLVLAGTHIANGSSIELERSFLAENPGLVRAVVDLGSVDEDEKAWLIAHADAVVYPSVYEGFGLVPFESALSGVPCLFAPQASLAEAAPHGTATISPWDLAASAAAAYAVLTDRDVRAGHVQALADAAGALTWSNAAASIVEIYREAAAAPVRAAATVSRDAVDRERKLTRASDQLVARLEGERNQVVGDYYALIAELGDGRGLIGETGSLPQDLQRALLALSARPALSGPLFAAMTRVFQVMRTFSRAVRRAR